MGGLKASQCSRKVCLGRMIARGANDESVKLKILKDIVGESAKAGVSLGDQEVESVLKVAMMSRNELKVDLEKLIDDIDLLHHTNHWKEIV